MKKEYLESAIKQFEYYRLLGENAIDQLPVHKLFWQYNEESNSIATIVKHLWGNMLSRWTDLMTTDGEKEWRDRDAEFENDIKSKAELQAKWNEGWECLLNSLGQLNGDDMEKIIYIRNQGHTIMEAINRQLAHYPYHIGQIVYIAKMAADGKWKSLTIPKGHSNAYNAEKFAQPKARGHYTDEVLKERKIK